MENFIKVVATALTVYGIETISLLIVSPPVLHDVATALTVYGIETFNIFNAFFSNFVVATALTVYGIETMTRQHVEI